MIEFDKNGYLLPYEIIEISLADFEQTFVSGMPDKEQRSKIFATYLQYLSELFEIVGKDFFQFVNGSFTTTKELPGDIDFVTFVDYKIYRKFSEEIHTFQVKWKPSKEVDATVLPFSFPGHPHFIQCHIIFENKKSLYGNSRPDKKGIRNPKGIIKIQFNG